jgi:ABC-type polysaccharide/polyol phosphate export permease
MADEMAFMSQLLPWFMVRTAMLKKNKMTMANRAKIRKNQLRRSVVISYLAIEVML